MQLYFVAFIEFIQYIDIIYSFTGKTFADAEKSVVTSALERQLLRDGPKSLDSRNVQAPQLRSKKCTDV